MVLMLEHVESVLLFPILLVLPLADLVLNVAVIVVFVEIVKAAILVDQLIKRLMSVVLSQRLIVEIFFWYPLKLD